MRVAPKALIRRMTPTATRLLEAAVGKAATGGFYEITVEHLLAAMLEPDEGDVIVTAGAGSAGTAFATRNSR